MSQRIDGQELLPDNDRQAVATRYLLGTLSEDERSHFEELFFSDDNQFEELEIAEGELIDRYVLNDLSADEANRFEKLLVSPRIAERVEVARILTKRVASESQQEEPVYPTEVRPSKKDKPPVPWYKAIISPALRPAFASGIALFLLPTVALVFVLVKLQNESRRLAYEQQQLEKVKSQIEEQKARYGQLETTLNQTQREKEEQQQLAEQYQQQLAEQQRSISVLGFLNPGTGTRSAGDNGSQKSVQSLKVPRNASEVNLNLNVTHGDYSSYEAIVRNIDTSKEVAKRTHLKPFPQKGRKYIQLKLNGKLLPPASYNVRVNGITTDGTSENFDDYSFKVSYR